MDSILVACSLIAATANTIAATTIRVIAMQISQSNVPSAIEIATRANDREFKLYVVALLLLAFITAYLTWRLRRSDNNLNELIRQDAIAQITETKTAQQRVELELSEQRERTAIAERALLELQEQQQPRHLDLAAQERIAAKLRRFAGQRSQLFVYSTGDTEPVGISNELIMILEPPKDPKERAEYLGPASAADWNLTIFTGQESGRAVRGIRVEVRTGSDATASLAAAALVSALVEEGVAASGPHPFITHGPTIGRGSWDKESPIVITVGKK
jgi:hypothetical protein